MCWDVAVSVHPLEYVLWHRSCRSYVHPPRFAYLCLTLFYMRVHLPLVYQKLGYIELVGRAAGLSMRANVEEVQALPEYTTKGEVPMTAK